MKKSLGVWLSLLWLVSLGATAWLAPLILPIEPFQPVAEPLLPPGSYPPLGTDALGRDFMDRLLLGSQRSLSAGVLAAGMAILTGLFLSLIATVSGKWVDGLVIGVINAALAIPGLLFALLLTASMGPGFRTVIIAIGIGLAPGYARLARSVFQQIRQAEYITAARSMGSSSLRIIMQHILPNAIRGLASFSALHFSWALMGITTLTFLGLSGDPSVPEWGVLLDSGRQYLQTAPRLAMVPGLLISLTVLAVYRLSEQLQ